MFYKLSNTANVDDMESVFGLTFKYPDIYSRNPLINGLDEEILAIITDTNLEQIQYGIWGILPEGYKEDWNVFQKTQNTLNTSVSDLKHSNKFSLDRRCAILVSGFFLTYIYKGEIYPFYAYPKSRKPFAIAGIYNITHDGFITFTMLLTNISPEVAKYHNVSKRMPIVLPTESYGTWLGNEYYLCLNKPGEIYDQQGFKTHPIAREFYKNEIVFESFLDPADYESLAIPFST